MEIGSSTIGGVRKIVGWVYGVVQRLACLRAYEISTLYYNHRELIEARPYPLGEHVGYGLFWGEYLRGARQRSPMIEVCATGDRKLSKVILSVSASNDKICYQDEIVFRNVDFRRHQAALPSVPFRHLKIKGNLVYTPYDAFHVKLVEIRDEEGLNLLPPWPIIHITHPMDRLEVALGEERDHLEKWGRVFHLGFIEMAINEELVRISAWRFHQGLIRKLTAPLQRRQVGKVLFWIKNFRHAAPLHRELERHIAQYNEVKLT